MGIGLIITVICVSLIYGTQLYFYIQEWQYAIRHSCKNPLKLWEHIIYLVPLAIYIILIWYIVSGKFGKELSNINRPSKENLKK